MTTPRIGLPNAPLSLANSGLGDDYLRALNDVLDAKVPVFARGSIDQLPDPGDPPRVFVVPGASPTAPARVFVDALSRWQELPSVEAVAAKAASDDPRLTNQRVPVDGSVSLAKLAFATVLPGSGATRVLRTFIATTPVTAGGWQTVNFAFPFGNSFGVEMAIAIPSPQTNGAALNAWSSAGWNNAGMSHYVNSALDQNIGWVGFALTSA